MLAISLMQRLLLAGALGWATGRARPHPAPASLARQNPPPWAGAAPAKGWRLVWADEFDQPGPG
ncbi:MAG: hypothetical protein EOO59_00610, partial [Hymenobacter sp.]